MVLDKKETTVAYRCPSCGAGVMSLVGAFALSADMIRLKCSCGGSEMTIVYTKDRSIRLTVPCLFCTTPHHYTLGDKLFFGRELFAFGCPYTGLDICYIGGRGAVGGTPQRQGIGGAAAQPAGGQPPMGRGSVRPGGAGNQPVCPAAERVGGCAGPAVPAGK